MSRGGCRLLAVAMTADTSERKRRKSVLNQGKNTLNVARDITERWRWGGLYVIHFPAGESSREGICEGSVGGLREGSEVRPACRFGFPGVDSHFECVSRFSGGRPRISGCAGLFGCAGRAGRS
jgi:hypothetical protein